MSSLTHIHTVGAVQSEKPSSQFFIKIVLGSCEYERIPHLSHVMVSISDLASKS